MSYMKRQVEEDAELVAKETGITWGEAIDIFNQHWPNTNSEWIEMAVKYKRGELKIDEYR